MLDEQAIRCSLLTAWYVLLKFNLEVLIGNKNMAFYMMHLEICCSCITFGGKNHGSCLYCDTSAIPSSTLCAYSIMFAIYVSTDTVCKISIKT